MHITRFRRLSLIFLCSLVISSAAYAKDSHALWAVKGRHNTVYFLGSIHLLPADEPLPDAMEQAYRDAKILVMEIDMDDLDPGATQATTMELGLLPEGASLQEQLGASDAKKLVDYAHTLGVDPAMLDRFRPWLAAMMLTQFQMMKLGLNPQAGVEQRFTTKAVTDHKEIRGLETMAEQLGFFAELSDRQQTQYLMYSIDDASSADADLKSMLTAWRTGDVPALAKLLQRGVDEFPDLYKRLTVDRNRHWLPTLERMLDEDQNYLVIVGALHLVGKNSVLDLLENRGYKVEQR